MAGTSVSSTCIAGLFLEHLSQRLLDQPRVRRHRMHTVDEQAQRRRLDAQVPIRRDVLDQLQRAAPQLARREISGVTGDSARSDASTAISSRTLRAPWVSISSKS